MSIDGMIATKTGESKFSSKQDLKRLHKLRSRVDAIVVGKNTILQDDPLLTVRHVQGKNPIRIIVDSKCTLSSKSQIVQTCNKVHTILAVSQQASKSNIQRIQKFPISLIVTGKNSVNIKCLLKKLFDKKIKTVLVEGGKTLNWEFIRLGFFDELIITVSPTLIGGENAISLVGGTGFKKISDSPNLRLKSARKLKNHLILHYLKV